MQQIISYQKQGNNRSDLDADDYRIIKSESEKTSNRLEVKLTTIATDTSHIAPLWDKAISTMSQIEVLYEKGTVIQKEKW